MVFPVWCGRTWLVCTDSWPQPHPTPLLIWFWTNMWWCTWTLRHLNEDRSAQSEHNNYKQKQDHIFVTEQLRGRNWTLSREWMLTHSHRCLHSSLSSSSCLSLGDNWERRLRGEEMRRWGGERQIWPERGGEEWSRRREEEEETVERTESCLVCV